MAKILFINPTVREEDVPRHVPYGIALLASIAMNDGHLVQIYDENAWRQGEHVLRQVLLADDWDVVGMGGISTSYGSVKEIVTLAEELCPDAVVMLGGGLLTSIPREIMGMLPRVDVGVVGEAFATFPKLLELIDAGSRDWASVDGVVYMDEESGKYKMTRPVGLLHDLDSLPYPAWELFPLEEVYFPNSQHLFSEEGMLSQRRLDVNASFGCSLVCKFCYHLGLIGDMRYVEDDDGETTVEFDTPGNYSRVIRYHSPEYIVGMIKHMYDTFNIDFVGFLDENLMTMDQYSKRTWMKEICERLHTADLAPVAKYGDDGVLTGWSGIHWSGTSHATLCNPEILKTMRAAGCSHLVYGYESFAPHVMKTIGKGATPKTNIRSFFWTLEAGIRPIPNQIIGFPNEDFESLYLNMDAWKRLGIIVKPFFATPYPGSEWFAVNREDILEQYDGDLEAFMIDLGDATRITAIISQNFNAVELYGLRELMLNFDYKRIREYEKEWRKNHGIEDGEPSTLYEERTYKKRPLAKIEPAQTVA